MLKRLSSSVFAHGDPSSGNNALSNDHDQFSTAVHVGTAHCKEVFCNLLKDYQNDLKGLSFRVSHGLPENSWFKTKIRFHMHLTVVIAKFYPLRNLQYVIWVAGYDNMTETVRISAYTALKLIWHVNNHVNFCMACAI